MSGKFLTPGEIADLKRSQDKVNSLQDREDTTGFHTELTVCGCPDPNCGGWHTVDLSRPLPSSEEAIATLKAMKKGIPKSKHSENPIL
ncbi:MAG: hypothetical protein ACSHYA_15900 [Opitutaceae bacterium]